MASERRLIDAKFAQHIANVELSPDNAGIVQWVLSHTPTVDAVQVVHGRWVALDDDLEELEDETEALRWGCTACHEIVEYDDWTHRSRLTRFCPNCGAKMDGGADDGI